MWPRTRSSVRAGSSGKHTCTRVADVQRFRDDNEMNSCLVVAQEQRQAELGPPIYAVVADAPEATAAGVPGPPPYSRAT